MDIHSQIAFTNTSQVQSLAISDMVQLTGVSLLQLQESNVHFVA
jgi:hypothetical protein